MTETAGVLAVVSGPSGVGKGSVCRELLRIRPNTVYSISATTRQPRVGEEDGINYHFISEEAFQGKIAVDDFLEWAQVYGNYYGTSKSAVDEMLAAGKDVILEIDTQGAMQIRSACPQGLLIFIMPPSFAELKKRITGRGSESAESLALRLSRAEAEMAMAEKHYDHLVVNHTVAQAAQEIGAILDAARAKRPG